MSLSKSFIEELKFKNDIESVIGSYVQIKRAGRNLKAKCPFHNETDASLVIYPQTQSFYCFGCGTAGDVINFIENIENLNYIDTIKLLADKVNMEVPQNNEEYVDNFKEKEIIYSINSESARFFYDNLVSGNNIVAQNYLKSRGISPNMIIKFGIGYASDNWDNLKNFLIKKGFKMENILKSGVVAKSESGKIYDQFRNRIIFPIINVRKKVVGFGGRLLGEKGPKYLNSPDTAVFKKSKNLFSLNFAKNFKTKQLILVEGFMDVISLYQSGFENTVATLGTALTTEQTYLVSNYADEVIIAYDSDMPGIEATKKAIDLFSKLPVEVKILELGKYKDPDEFIKKNSKEKFSVLIENSLPSLDYLIKKAKDVYDLNSLDGRSRYLNEAILILSKTNDALKRDIYAGKLASDLSVDKITVNSQINSYILANSKKIKKQKNTQNNNASAKITKNLNNNDDSSVSRAVLTAEEDIILTLYRKNELYSWLKERVSYDDFITPEGKNIYINMTILMDASINLDVENMKANLSKEEFSKYIYIINKQTNNYNNLEHLEGCIEKLKIENGKKNMHNLEDINNQDLDEYIKKLSSRKKGE